MFFWLNGWHQMQDEAAIGCVVIIKQLNQNNRRQQFTTTLNENRSEWEQIRVLEFRSHRTFQQDENVKKISARR